MKKVKIVLVGIGGYGQIYVKSLLEQIHDGTFSIAGAVDPSPQASAYWQQLRELNIPFYADMDSFYKHAEADLAVISSPIQYHAEQTRTALLHGSHVLCEKPLPPSVEDADDLIRLRDQSGKFVAIGYQWSFSPAMLELKKDVMEGRFGRAIRLETLILWPRSDNYYARSWAGKYRDGDGLLVMDSIANNATAHYIHNMFFLLGDSLDRSAAPAFIEAELYRANPIENYDTAAMRCITDGGTELLYHASHAVNITQNPLFTYEFEKAVVSFSREQGIVAELKNGERLIYGNPDEDPARKLRQAISAVRGEAVLPCGIEASFPHMLSILGMQESTPDIAKFPPTLVKRGVFPDQYQGFYVEGLFDALKACHANYKLPSEMGFSWAKKGKRVELGELFSYRESGRG